MLQDVDEESKQAFRAPIDDTQVLPPPTFLPPQNMNCLKGIIFPLVGCR
jgi:hypothetical protein